MDEITNLTEPQPLDSPSIPQTPNQITPNPPLQQTETKPKSNFIIFVVIGLIILLILAGIGGFFLLKNSENNKQVFSETNSSVIENKTISQDYTPTPPSSPTPNPTVTESSFMPTGVVFDIPLLLNKNKDEIKRLLGTPAKETNYETDSYLFYSKNNYSIQIEYFPNQIDKQKFDFGYIGIDVATNLDKETIFKELNLSQTSNQYIVGIRRFESEPKNINQVYVFPPGSKYYNPTDFTQ